MRPTKRPPTHPGEMIRELCLEPLGMSVSELSRRLGVCRKHLSAVVNGKSGIGIDMAIRLSEAFETTPEVWLNCQMKWDLWQALRKREEHSTIAPLGASPGHGHSTA